MNASATMEEPTREELFELLRFESVSSNPAKLRDSAECALWWKKWLAALGFDAELRMPDIKDGIAAPPIVFAKREGSETKPVVLIYGHYDVQPVDPVSEWKTPPFEPTERDGRIYCRGANDDKGQTFAFMCGLRDFIASAKPEDIPTIKVVFEGQEESGSAALIKLAPEWRRDFAADILAVCDTSAGKDLRPAIVAGLRGVGHFTIRLTGPARDLHSGSYGGIAPNPAQAIAELVASLHNKDGSIAVAGFRDGIEPPTEPERRAAEASSPTEADYAADIGCEPAGGQMGKTLVQRNSFEPTIEVNGIHSGYGGSGSKTVIPSEAIAKISMRLVAGQSPRAAFDAIRSHLEERVPRGMKMSLEECNSGISGFRLALDSPAFRLAADILGEMDDRGAVFLWDGASIPVVSVIREVSGAAPLIVGWGQPEDCIHSPNESYSLAQFAKAREWSRRLFAAL